LLHGRIVIVIYYKPSGSYSKTEVDFKSLPSRAKVWMPSANALSATSILDVTDEAA
jgi:hypothetical protein